MPNAILPLPATLTYRLHHMLMHSQLPASNWSDTLWALDMVLWKISLFL